VVSGDRNRALSAFGKRREMSRVLINVVGFEIETWIMLFATAVGARFKGKEQDEA
jgi:hypothetical protein